jgi:predicted ATPase
MLVRISISRFRGFKSLAFGCSPVTAIIGPNSSGKTSVLGAIRFVCDALRVALDHSEVRPIVRGETVQVCGKLVLSDMSLFTAAADWRQLFTDAVVGDGASFEIELLFEPSDPLQRVALELHYGRNAQPLLSLSVDSRAVIANVDGIPAKSSQRPLRLRDELRRVIPLSYFVPPFYGVMRSEEYRALPVMNRLLSGGDQNHIVRNLVARLDSGALARLNAFLGRTLGAEIAHRTSQMEAEQVSELAVHYRDTNGALEVSTAGAGLISLIAIYAAMERSRHERAAERGRPIIFLLDEPEAHLHPRLQGEIGAALADLSRDVDVQLLLATHSVEMINRLGRRDEAAIVSVDRRTSAAIELNSESDVLDKLDDFCDLTPFTSLNFLASRRILFYEGPTDHKILAACARVCFAKNDRATRTWESYTPVPLDGISNVSMRGVLARVISPKLFPKIEHGAPVTAALAQDRDYTRDPQAPASEPGDIIKVTAVWSRHSIESLFLDQEILTACLCNVTGAERAVVLPLVMSAIAAANSDQELLDTAADGLYRRLRRPAPRGDDPQATILPEQAAIAQARKTAREEPWIWQRGKDRARAILNQVRAEAPPELRKRIRGSVVDLLERINPDDVADVAAMIPAEIRRFLDLLVAH